MRIDPDWVQAAAGFIAALAALMGASYAVVTRPLLKRMDDIRADLTQFKVEVHSELVDIRSELRDIRTELKNQGERLARVEERLPPPLVQR